MTRWGGFQMVQPLATRRDVITAISIAGSSLAMNARAAGALSEEISRQQESIHQEIWLRASAARVYLALTDPEQFQKITMLGAGASSGMVNSATTAQISSEVGGAFELFGGIIYGRHIELRPNERIVQAWRETGWPPGVYSIARFELRTEGKGTRLLFDHTGFPTGTAEHLAEGWKGNYWEPLGKLLS